MRQKVNYKKSGLFFKDFDIGCHTT